MEKKNIDWSNLGFGYVKTDYRFVSDFKDNAWDEGRMTQDETVVINECAGVLQYAQTVFEGMKAYTGRTHCHLPPGFKCQPDGRFCQTTGNACVPGGPFRRSCCKHSKGKCCLCSTLWIWRNLVYPPLYVRHQSGDWRKTGR